MTSEKMDLLPRSFAATWESPHSSAITTEDIWAEFQRLEREILRWALKSRSFEHVKLRELVPVTDPVISLPRPVATLFDFTKNDIQYSESIGAH